LDFKQWLTDIYRTVKNILHVDTQGKSRSVEIGDDIREVMGRILTNGQEREQINASAARGPAAADSGQKVVFRLKGSGAALSGYLLKTDETTVKIRAGGQNFTILRDKGDFKILPAETTRNKKNGTNTVSQENKHSNCIEIA
jgi:hypothetical protein